MSRMGLLFGLLGALVTMGMSMEATDGMGGSMEVSTTRGARILAGWDAATRERRMQKACQFVPKNNCTVVDVLFVLDASFSLSREHFYDETLDFLDTFYCALPQGSQAGVILFSDSVEVPIRLGVYSKDEWFAEVQAIRDDPNACCSKSTPHAEAFEAAYNELVARARNDFRLVYVLTDGHPWQLPVGKWSWPKVDQATYWYEIVPREANQVKALPNTHIVVGTVPRKDNIAVSTNYFMGIPEKSWQNHQSKNPKAQCPQPQRGGKRSCGVIRIPPFPIASSAQETLQLLDFDALFNRTFPLACCPPGTSPFACCLIQGKTVEQCCAEFPDTPECRSPPPTESPTTPPPTTSPTPQSFDSLDLYLILDRSRSMTWVPHLCRNAPGADNSQGDKKACWSLFIDFSRQLVADVLQFTSPKTPVAMGWQGDSGNPAAGLRVTVVAFWCSNEQSTPEMKVIGELLNTQAKFDAAMDWAFNKMTPDGGTCPSNAIQKVVNIVSDNLDPPRWKSSLIFTDGVWYDMPAPQEAVQGLKYFDVLRFSLGIAIPNSVSDHGLTPAEIQTQKQQLLIFAGDQSRVKNLGANGFNLLNPISAEFAQLMGKTFEGSAIQKKLDRKPYWCGYPKKVFCVAANNCKWNPELGCRPKGKCRDLGRKACIADKYCKWPWSACYPKDQWKGID